MTEYVHLIGADDVSRAGSTISAAADSISRSVGYLEDALERHRARRDEADEREHIRRQEALDRFEQIAGRLEKCVNDAMLFLQSEDLRE